MELMPALGQFRPTPYITCGKMSFNSIPICDLVTKASRQRMHQDLRLFIGIKRKRMPVFTGATHAPNGELVFRDEAKHSEAVG